MCLLDVFPELRRKEDGCKEQRLPIAVLHFDTLGRKLQLLKDLPHEQYQVSFGTSLSTNSISSRT
jgi:hypothetical protein